MTTQNDNLEPAKAGDHFADCATNNEPMMRAGACNCGGQGAEAAEATR